MKRKLNWLSMLAFSFILVGCAENVKEEAIATADDVTEEKAREHDHQHELNEKQEKVYNGYFEDEEIQDRPLSDWSGDWQSVYRHLQDGTLDEVFEHKASNDDSQTFEDFKTYYETGYKTTTDRIVIEDRFITFYDHGHAHKGEYAYDSYEILTYEKGNRGVRFIFKHVGDETGVPAYVQFSDHIIAPQKSGHYHIYWGDDREALLKEITNWPTYYPSHMNGHEIAHEMIAH
ncbi:MAG: metal-binding protein ZinT [Solibacillus sp.]|uniref:ZinT family metal-binding protein n=1 Tax=Solibacillus sp. TaxID=1909654 RepID=UPI0033155346